MVVLIVESALLAALLFMMAGLTGTDIDVPDAHSSRIVALVFSLFGLVLWQDAEVLNLLGRDTSNSYGYLILQKVKSTLQRVGA